ncbi:hypothetical protein BDF20DRAFT_814687 [Mycotypha africana]|uniref:uncharacterized protein n=1 Tax=Mycotypha africana TaxID=64632 RepID=UPI0023000F40|nr:uncharacterized protein BDF20DRAFT_814687 [Mycotypha africana]KAI8987906.1 hypothetical protein BDF20DRAFT_814687 [Mycotypha africana]
MPLPPPFTPLSPVLPSETLTTKRPTSLLPPTSKTKRFQLFSSELGLIQLDELLNEEGQKALETIIGQTTTTSKKKKQESERREQLLKQQGLLIEDVSLSAASSPESHPNTATTTTATATTAITKTGCWWMDCSNPTPKELEVISKTFRIHPLTTEDIQVQEQREKVELFPHYTFVCFRAFDVDPISELIKPFNFYILIFKEGLVTFHFQPSPHCDTVRERCDQLKSYMDMTPDWMNYALIDAITDSFAPIILEVEMEAVSIDELSLVLRKADRADMLKRISRCRKKSTQVARLLGSKIDVIKSLKKRYQEKIKEQKIQQQQLAQQHQQSDLDLQLQYQQLLEQFPFSDVLLYLSDIQDHVVTMIQNINHYDRILHRAHTNYLAQVNLELIETYNRTNSVMNRLTFLATVFIPLTIIGSLWGMNVYVPGKGHSDDSYFWWILAGMAIYTAVCLHFGKRLGLV